MGGIARNHGLRLSDQGIGGEATLLSVVFIFAQHKNFVYIFIASCSKRNILCEVYFYGLKLSRMLFKMQTQFLYHL